MSGVGGEGRVGDNPGASGSEGADSGDEADLVTTGVGRICDLSLCSCSMV